MGIIKSLSQNVINQIAAGEVVERPASVVKELLENSLDAGATKIIVRLEKGGLRSITVVDNGSGMHKDDAVLAFSSHTTSKISQIEDLNQLQTLGFRGEALASISSVSKVILETAKEGRAVRVELEGGSIKAQETSAFPEGTSLSVTDLFFNVPARRKFLKTEQTELRHILKAFEEIATANSKVQFRLFNNNKVIYDLLPAERIWDRILQIRKLNDEDFFDLFYDGKGLKITGKIGHPGLAGKAGGNQQIFINTRPIRDRGITRSMISGYGTTIPKGSYPRFFIFMQVDPRLIDFNVHPRKIEVRFTSPYEVYRAVERAVETALEKGVKGQELEELKLRQDESGVKETAQVDKEELLERMRKSDEAAYDRLRGSGRSEEYQAGHGYGGGKLKDVRPLRDDAGKIGVEEGMKFTEMLLTDSDVLESSPTLQFLNRYIVTQKNDRLQIYDQHAVAERIRFEKLMADIDGGSVETQGLLVPVEVASLSKSELEVVKEYKDFVGQLGFNVELSGKGRVVKVLEVPAAIAGADIAGLFKDLVAELAEFMGRKRELSVETCKEYVVKTMACHSSLRANERISTEEARRLIEDLGKCKEPSSCPHGRPVVFELSIEELDKRFRRG